MPSYKINLNIMPIPSVLDPQGEAIENSLKNSTQSYPILKSTMRVTTGLESHKNKGIIKPQGPLIV